MFSGFLIFVFRIENEISRGEAGTSPSDFKSGALAQCAVGCPIVSVVWTVLFPIPKGMRR